jgi:hypothetical protein
MAATTTSSSLRASWPTTSAMRRPALASSSRASRRATTTALAAKKTDDGLDPIERAVAFLFGKKALEDEQPMGLKRLNFDKMPDQKVETERLAAPLPGDDADARLLRPLLAGTQLETEALACVYDTGAKRGDAWSPVAFHEAARARGAAIVLAVTEAGSWCGGYNPLGFLGFGDEHATSGAFLFTWTPGGDPRAPGAQPVKLPKIGGASLAVIDAPNEGPRFGAEGLSVPLQPPDARACRSRLGTYYARLPKGADAGRRSVILGSEEPDATGRKARLARLAVFVAEKVPDYRLEAGSIVWRSSE